MSRGEFVSYYRLNALTFLRETLDFFRMGVWLLRPLLSSILKRSSLCHWLHNKSQFEKAAVKEFDIRQTVLHAGSLIASTTSCESLALRKGNVTWLLGICIYKWNSRLERPSMAERLPSLHTFLNIVSCSTGCILAKKPRITWNHGCTDLDEG